MTRGKIGFGGFFGCAKARAVQLCSQLRGLRGICVLSLPWVGQGEGRSRVTAILGPHDISVPSFPASEPTVGKAKMQKSVQQHCVSRDDPFWMLRPLPLRSGGALPDRASGGRRADRGFLSALDALTASKLGAEWELDEVNFYGGGFYGLHKTVLHKDSGQKEEVEVFFSTSTPRSPPKSILELHGTSCAASTDRRKCSPSSLAKTWQSEDKDLGGFSPKFGGTL